MITSRKSFQHHRSSYFMPPCVRACLGGKSEQIFDMGLLKTILRVIGTQEGNENL